jgi:hypothetical protein
MKKSRRRKNRTNAADSVGGNIPDLPLEQIRPLSISSLAFDRENPRFTPDKEMGEARPVDIIQEFIRSADLKELVESIASNGYIDIEPLVVMRPRNSGRYTVLEGNRRLAALRVLTDPSLAAEAGFQVPGYTADAAAIALDQPRQAAVNGLSGLRSLPRRRTGDCRLVLRAELRCPKRAADADTGTAAEAHIPNSLPVTRCVSL